MNKNYVDSEGYITVQYLPGNDLILNSDFDSDLAKIQKAMLGHYFRETLSLQYDDFIAIANTQAPLIKTKLQDLFND